MHTSLSKDLTEKEELPTQLPNYGGRKAHVLAKWINTAFVLNNQIYQRQHDWFSERSAKKDDVR